ncbi:hypothetical protein Tco_0230283, partial [Tanacetum coccineum]
ELIKDENAMDKGVADTFKDHKRKHDDDKDPPAGPNKDKMTKSSKTGKTTTVEKMVKELIDEVVMDDPVNTTAEDVVPDVDQPYDSTRAKDKVSKQDRFKQPPRPPTPDPEWKKSQVVLDQP